MPVEIEHALGFIETLVVMGEMLADAFEQLADLTLEENADLEGLMTATLGCTNRARQFVALVRELEDS